MSVAGSFGTIGGGPRVLGHTVVVTVQASLILLCLPLFRLKDRFVQIDVVLDDCHLLCCLLPMLSSHGKGCSYLAFLLERGSLQRLLKWTGGTGSDISLDPAG